MKKLNALGKQCPIPVIMSKQEVKAGNEFFSIDVDNEYAVENLKNFAESCEYSTEVKENNSVYTVTFKKNGTEIKEEIIENKPNNAVGDWALFVGKDILGDGSRELGLNLMRMFFFTLTQDENAPKYILFMNSGVKLALEDEQIIEHLEVLSEIGSDILICGTCKNFFNIQNEPKVGRISNMYEITEKMKSAQKVISL